MKRTNHISLSARNLTIISLSIIILIGQLGCAVKTSPPRVSEELRAGLGTIAVAPALFAPKQSEFPVPAKGRLRGAGRGLATGFMAGAESGAYLPSDAGLADVAVAAGYLGLIATSTVIGGIYGAATAESETTVEEAEVAYKKALATIEIQQALGERILECAHTQAPHTFVLVDQGRRAADETPDYRPLASSGIDTILEINVLQFGLAGEGKINPPLHLSISVRAKLIQAGYNRDLYARTFDYSSQSHKFIEWTANGAELFRRTAEHACQELSDQIVSALFLPQDLE